MWDTDRGANPVTGTLRRLATVLRDTESVDEVLRRMADVTAGMPGVDACGVVLLRKGQDREEVVTAASAETARVLDEAQHGAVDGPSRHALRHDEVVVVDDLCRELRWPGFVDVAVARGVRSVYAHPLPGNRHATGVLTCYGHRPGAFTDSEAAEILGILAGHVQTLLSLVVRRAEQIELANQFRAALNARSIIDQAIGILMAQRRVGPEQAFQFLRQASNRSNVKLRDLAAHIVASVTPGSAGGTSTS